MFDHLTEITLGTIDYYYNARRFPVPVPENGELTFTWWIVPHPCGGAWEPGPTFD